MELEIMYPRIIIYSLIISVGLLFVWKAQKNFKKGIIVANTHYVKSTKYYRQIMIRYRIYSILIKAVCFALIFACAFLTSRYYELHKMGEEVHNRDIMLCMDISGSVNTLNQSLVKTMKETISALKNERFGITVFDSMPYTLVPLTSDYKYALSILDQVEKSLKTKYNPFAPDSGSYVRDFLYGGVQNTSNDARGYSLVGDGLGYCATNFKKEDKRTKVIILTTDNEVVGEQILTVPESATYCRNNGIKIYSIGTENISEDAKNELVNASNKTGGKYYDFKSYSTKEIASEIESLSKSAITKSVRIETKDYPEIIVPYLLYLIPILFILDWRIRL